MSDIFTVQGATDLATGQLNIPDGATQQRVPVLSQVTARRSVTIINSGAAVVYLGDKTVSAAVGFPLPAGAAITLEIASELWASTANGSGGTSLGFIAEMSIRPC